MPAGGARRQRGGHVRTSTCPFAMVCFAMPCTTTSCPTSAAACTRSWPRAIQARVDADPAAAGIAEWGPLAFHWAAAHALPEAFVGVRPSWAGCRTVRRRRRHKASGTGRGSLGQGAGSGAARRDGEGRPLPSARRPGLHSLRLGPSQALHPCRSRSGGRRERPAAGQSGVRRLRTMAGRALRATEPPGGARTCGCLRGCRTVHRVGQRFAGDGQVALQRRTPSRWLPRVRSAERRGSGGRLGRRDVESRARVESGMLLVFLGAARKASPGCARASRSQSRRGSCDQALWCAEHVGVQPDDGG